MLFGSIVVRSDKDKFARAVALKTKKEFEANQTPVEGRLNTLESQMSTKDTQIASLQTQINTLQAELDAHKHNYEDDNGTAVDTKETTVRI